MMSEGQAQPVSRLVANSDQPLIAVLIERDGQQEVVYFVDDALADQALRTDTAQPVIKLAGV